MPGIRQALGHKLVYVMVVTVVNAVDVTQLTVPACPLAIAYPTPGKADSSTTIGINTVAKIEVLYLYLILASHNGSNDILELADGVSEASSSILHNTYATLPLIIGYLRWSGPRSVPAPPGPSLYPTPLLYSIVLYLSTSCGNIL
jgi:hypothetical protein